MSNIFSLDEKTLRKIEEKFQERQKLSENRKEELFGVFNENLTEEEEILLKLLYAYMPSNDLADYDGKVFLQYVKDTLEIRNKVSWGKKIPDEVFLNFILPYRVSNEKFDSYRMELFNSLYERVKNLSMIDAIDQVIHWYNENSTYIPSDPRTLSPLSVLTAGRGRCGEGSTLIVAALRSVGIPARQCYTGLWAHCDSNHAWVEAWADGEWCLFGDNRPEEKLSNGFFKSPAIRAMLVNARTPGIYTGNEEVIKEHTCVTEINVLDNYAPSKTITVKVVDEDDKIVKGAKVSFQLYNFGNLFDLIVIPTNDAGKVTLKVGYGDFFVYAHNEKAWGFKKISVKDGEEFKITISEGEPKNSEFEFDLVPPIELPMEGEELSEEEAAKSNLKVRNEEKMRKEYEATFVSKEESDKLAERVGLSADRLWKVIPEARGNSHKIYKFIEETTKENREWALRLLEVVNPKDLIDTSIEVFKENLNAALKVKGEYSDDVFAEYVLNNRIGFEKLTAYNSFFQEKFSEEDKKNFKNNPKEVMTWVKDNIEVLKEFYHYQGIQTPKGTYEFKKADPKSYDVLIVAMGRSFGIPARLEPMTKEPQFFIKEEWVNVNTNASNKEDLKCEDMHYGSVKLIKDKNIDEKIEYYTHFGISKFKDNIYEGLDLSSVDLNEGDKVVPLEEGHYRLATGHRLPDGTVLTKVTNFTIKPNETTEVTVSLRKDELEVPVIQKVRKPCTFEFINGEKKKIEEIVDLKPGVFAWVEPNSETSKHIIGELGELKEEFEALNINICLCVNDNNFTSTFNKENYKGLPNNTKFVIDHVYDSLKAVNKENTTMNFPCVFIIDSNCEVRYISTGYKLGTGRHLINILKKLIK